MDSIYSHDLGLVHSYTGGERLSEGEETRTVGAAEPRPRAAHPHHCDGGGVRDGGIMVHLRLRFRQFLIPTASLGARCFQSECVVFSTLQLIESVYCREFMYVLYMMYVIPPLALLLPLAAPYCPPYRKISKQRQHHYGPYSLARTTFREKFGQQAPCRDRTPKVRGVVGAGVMVAVNDTVMQLLCVVSRRFPWRGLWGLSTSSRHHICPFSTWSVSL